METVDGEMELPSLQPNQCRGVFRRLFCKSLFSLSKRAELALAFRAASG